LSKTKEAAKKDSAPAEGRKGRAARTAARAIESGSLKPSGWRCTALMIKGVQAASAAAAKTD
jgi:hypothetical protein